MSLEEFKKMTDKNLASGKILSKLLNLESLPDLIGDKNNLVKVLKNNYMHNDTLMKFIVNNRDGIVDKFFDYFQTFTFSVYHTDTKIFDIWSREHQFKTCCDMSSMDGIDETMAKLIMGDDIFEGIYFKVIHSFIVDIFNHYLETNYSTVTLG